MYELDLRFQHVETFEKVDDRSARQITILQNSITVHKYHTRKVIVMSNFEEVTKVLHSAENIVYPLIAGKYCTMFCKNKYLILNN